MRSLKLVTLFLVWAIVAGAQNPPAQPPAQPRTPSAPSSSPTGLGRTVPGNPATDETKWNTPPNTIDVSVRTLGGGLLTGRARVVLYRAMTEVRSTFCSGTCEVAFRDIQDGTYFVEVEMPTYERPRQQVTVYNGLTARVILQLVPLDEGELKLTDPLVDAHWLAASEKARDAMQRARDFRRVADYKKAVEHSTVAAQSDPKSALVHEELAVSYWKAGDVEKARKEFDTAIEMDPAFLTSYMRLAEMLFEKKDYAGAGAVLLRGTKAQPNRAEPFKLMAQIQLDTGHPDKAEQACLLGLQKDYSRIPEIYIVLANVYLRRDERDKAASALRSYLQQAPKGNLAELARNTLERIKK